MLWNAAFIVWRESLEAILVVAILLSWLRAQQAAQPDAPRAPLQRFVWGGVAAGALLALLLALLIYAADSWLPENAMEWFQLALVFFAAGLLLQMVLWMRRHGRYMKQDLQHGAQSWQSRFGGVGLGLLAMLAVGREGAETVVFLYGLGLQQEGIRLVLLSTLLGLGLALAMAHLIARGAKQLNYRMLFRVTEFVLLALALSMLGNGIDRGISMDWLPPLKDPVWDVSRWLDDSGIFGQLLHDFFGYRARPSGTLLIAYAAFIALAAWGLKRASGQQGSLTLVQAGKHATT